MIEQTFQLLTRDVTLSGIVAAENAWPYQDAYSVYERPNNQLFCNLVGTRDYYDAQGQLYLTANVGDVLLMPAGTTYVTIPTSFGGNLGVAVLFNLKDDQGQEIILDTQVRLVARDQTHSYVQTMRKLRECMLQGGFSLLKAKGMLYDLLYSLATDQSLIQLTPQLKSILPAIRYLGDNLQSSVSIDTLAELCFMSKSTFHRRFLAEFHLSPIAYHLNARIEKSRELLRSGLYSVEQVAEIMGFCDAGYFSRMFHKRTGEYAGDCRRSFSEQRKNRLD